ncbi:peptidase inhibitor family I36 protein [Actinoplanes flavus]|uniref:Peptidase inhibitor family I36 protein n=1 Tax=Actinoplanes flavus TaxID=2820290 RepID=A0ABS3UD93_9ACTN|nr:peptidase inhibitor family I36 protein [Actinoplanes flavus]MBO3736732.1 peptidase inhibitor family I36 protein [Actinoplanes flavus]
MIKKLALTLTAALAAGLAVGAPAAASDDSLVRSIKGHGIDACPAESLCLYEHSKYNGDSDASIWVVSDDVQRLSEHGADDTASSAYLNAPNRWSVSLWRDVVWCGDHVRLNQVVRGVPSLHDAYGYTGCLGEEKQSHSKIRLNDSVSSVLFLK